MANSSEVHDADKFGEVLSAWADFVLGRWSGIVGTGVVGVRRADG